MTSIKKDSIDQSVVIRIIDSTDRTPENAVEYNTAGIDLWYRREGAIKINITEVALAALDSTHSDGGIELIGDGYYRLDLPDAALASGANGVMIAGTVTGMIIIGCYISLVDYDPYDQVRMGMTALPDAAADAAGGLPVSDAGELDLDNILDRILNAVEIRVSSVNDVAATTTKFISNLTETTDDFWNRMAVLFTGGQNNGQMRRIKDYNGENKEIKVQTPFSYVPANADTFILCAVRAFLTPDIEDLADAIWDEISADHIIADSFGRKLTDIHDEAFGKWILDPIGKTLTLYKADGISVLKIFDLDTTQGTMPAFIARTPQ